MEALKNLLDLIYPRTCASCKQALRDTDAPVCISCILDLPIILSDVIQQTKIRQKFDGKVNINDAKSYLLFQKGNVAQKLIYALKYNNNKNIGLWLGKRVGFELVKLSKQDKIDFIVPVPLHPAKEKQRGYNQAEIISKGLSEVLDIPVEAGILRKIKHNTSQTKKDRFERYLNTTNIFEVVDKSKLAGKSVYLIDDVLTTGSTLEAAAYELITCGCQVYIITIASAN